MHLRHLSRLLDLLLGIFCLGGACELDAKECKQNYGKESHDYVLAAAVDAHDAALHLAPLPDAPAHARLAVALGSGCKRSGPLMRNPAHTRRAAAPAQTLPAPRRAASLKTKPTPLPGGPCLGSPGVVFVRF